MTSSRPSSPQPVRPVATRDQLLHPLCTAAVAIAVDAGSCGAATGMALSLLLPCGIARSRAFMQLRPAGGSDGQPPSVTRLRSPAREACQRVDGRPSAALRERAGSLTQWIKSRPLYDRLYALYENSRWSTREIEPFIRKYHIDMAEFEPLRYRSFAKFFDRRFRPGVRTFPSAPEEMGAFAEARYLG
jgi:hypothetical protein